jgi:hypothetical protein
MRAFRPVRGVMIALVGIGIAGAATSGKADEQQPGGPPDHVYAKFAEQSGVSVEMLKQQRERTGLGLGALRIANRLAAATGKNFDEIVATHKAGKGWGEIATDHGLNLGQLLNKPKPDNNGNDQ